MQNDAVKETLQLYLQLTEELHELRKRLREVESALFSPGRQKIGGVKRPKGQGSGTGLADVHLDLQRRCQEKQAEILAAQLQFEKMIYPLEPRERLLLRYRYLDGLHWDEISKKLDCNVSQAHRIHNSTLAELKQNAEK
ncbi:MAG: hypothetical protein IKV72_00240 [Firmicutes bacterium]|nr:hypothetical protein [Bacillota bacterium]